MADRPLLAIYTCHKYDYEHPVMKDWLIHPVVDRVPAVRDTWLNDVDIDYRMFYGRLPEKCEHREPSPDEVFLNSPDGYYTLVQKTQALARWALEHNYNRLLKVDDDVYIHWDRMRNSAGFSTGEYAGGGFSRGESYAFGGCYWVGERALEVIANSPVSGSDWAEDRWVGMCLGMSNIVLEFEPRYYFHRAPESTRLQCAPDDILHRKHSYISIHAVLPGTMRSYHSRIGRGA